MFLIRPSKPEDTASLVKLARTVYFINLPPYEHLVQAKIEHSQRCFRRLSELEGARARGKGQRARAGGATRKAGGIGGAIGGMAQLERESDVFMFSIVDAESGGVIGTSQIRTHMGGPGNPNWRLAVTEKKFYSESLRFGTTHTVARLDGDETGPSEIGGLILDPGFRGHKKRPGRLLSFIRFQLAALYRELFADTILAEMMGPVTSDGDNPFWDALGRKFIPVKFAEADRFCQHNRKFIEELLPKDEIYITLLPLEVINLVGVVGRDTLPARRMLESLGFRYRGFVDPFDGGPHLDCPTDQVPLVQWTRRADLGKATTPERAQHMAMVSVIGQEGDFRGTEALVEMSDEGPVRLLPDAMELLQVQAGMRIGVTPLRQFGQRSRDEGVAQAPVGGKTSGRKARSTGASAGTGGTKATRSTTRRS